MSATESVRVGRQDSTRTKRLPLVFDADIEGKRPPQ